MNAHAAMRTPVLNVYVYMRLIVAQPIKSWVFALHYTLKVIYPPVSLNPALLYIDFPSSEA